MKLQNICSFLALSLPLSTVFAGSMGPVLAPSPMVCPIELIAGGGWANLDISRTSIQVTRDEIDVLAHRNDNWDTGIVQLGAGYVAPFMDGSNFFHTFRVQLNDYYTSDSFNGPVYRFGDPSFADYNYKMKVQSNRVMLDGLMDLYSLNNYSLYAKGGIGSAWNRARYSDAGLVSFDCLPNGLAFNADTRFQFAAEAGAGLRYDLSKSIGVSLEYLYAYLGKAGTGSGTGGSCVAVVDPINFNLNVQSAILALHYTFS